MAYSVLDYVRGGCSMKFMVAIDFTVSVNASKFHIVFSNQNFEAILNALALTFLLFDFPNKNKRCILFTKLALFNFT